MRQGADNTAVNADILWIGGRADIDKDIARMHIGVEKRIAKDLGKEDPHATLGENLEVDLCGRQGGYIRDRRAIDAFQH